MTAGLQIRALCSSDPEVIERSFSRIGWSKPVSLFCRYLSEQAAGTRSCWVARVSDAFAGYITLEWYPSYPALAEQRVPEIQDLNVLPAFRRKGIGTALLDRAESEAAGRSQTVCISVGLHPGYNPAQRLYVKRGYIPDGLGVTYKGHFLAEGDQVTLDDDFLLHLVKRIHC